MAKAPVSNLALAPWSSDEMDQDQLCIEECILHISNASQRAIVVRSGDGEVGELQLRAEGDVNRTFSGAVNAVVIARLKM